MLRLKKKFKAFSLVELLVVLFLLAIVGVMTVRSLDTSSKAVSSNLEYSRAQTAIREMSYQVERSISQARPLNDCTATLGATGGADTCLTVTVGGEAIASNAPSSNQASCLIYFSYPSGADGNTQALNPEPIFNVARVVKKEQSDQYPTLVVEQYKDVTQGYDNIDLNQLVDDSCNPSRSLGAPLSKGNLNRVYELGRNIIPADPSLPEAERYNVFSYNPAGDISWVKLNTKVETDPKRERSISMTSVINIPSMQYQQERVR